MHTWPRSSSEAEPRSWNTSMKRDTVPEPAAVCEQADGGFDGGCCMGGV